MSDVITSLSDLNRLRPVDVRTDLRGDVDVLLDDLFTYHKWSELQIKGGEEVRDTLKAAYKAVLANVPSCPTRTRALNAILDARMLANAAVTFDGRV